MRTVQNRCVPEKSEIGKYRSFDGYVSLWLFVVNDTYLCIRFLTVCALLVAILSLLFFTALVALPRGSLFFCYFLGTFFMTFSFSWHLKTLIKDHGKDTSVIDTMLHGFIATMSLGLFGMATYTFVAQRKRYHGAACILAESTMCLRALPRLIGIGLANIFVDIFFLGMLWVITRFLTSCLSHKNLENGRITFVSSWAVFYGDYWLVVFFCVWLTRVTRILLRIVVAKKVAGWYFVEVKGIRRASVRKNLSLSKSELMAATACAFENYYLHELLLEAFNTNIKRDAIQPETQFQVSFLSKHVKMT